MPEINELINTLQDEGRDATPSDENNTTVQARFDVLGVPHLVVYILLSCENDSRNSARWRQIVYRGREPDDEKEVYHDRWWIKWSDDEHAREWATKPIREAISSETYSMQYDDKGFSCYGIRAEP